MKCRIVLNPAFGIVKFYFIAGLSISPQGTQGKIISFVFLCFYVCFLQSYGFFFRASKIGYR